MKNKSITIEIWDNGGKTADRYFIAVSGLMECDNKPYTYFMYSSENPFHPQGIGLHGDEELTAVYKSRRGGMSHMGKRITFFELPKYVQRFIAQELMPEE